jgi:uncharacterized membrane protein
MTLTIGRRSTQKLVTFTLWLITLIAAAGFSWIVPPMQSPDEDSHTFRAYMISKGNLLLQPVPAYSLKPPDDPEVAALVDRTRRHEGRAGGFVDKSLLRFSEVYMALARTAANRLTHSELGLLSQLEWTEDLQYYPVPGTGYYFPAVYAPQAVGLAAGRLMNWNISHSYQLMRVCALIACFAMLWMAGNLLKPNPMVVAILLLPMSLFQLVSPTLDGLTTSLAILTVSQFLACIDQSRKQSLAISWGLAICIFVLATSRTHLLPLLALPFYVAWQRNSRRDFFLGCLITAATLGWVLFALFTTNDQRIVRNHTTLQLLMQYAANPLAYFEIVTASVTDAKLFTFYQQSFVGILGWLDTPLTWYFYPALWVGLALCALASVSVATLHKDWYARLLLSSISVASIGLIFLAMLVTWTPHPASTAEGVQGRYFVVPAILLGYALSGCATHRSPRRQWTAGLVVAGFALTSLAALTMAVLGRYH